MRAPKDNTKTMRRLNPPGSKAAISFECLLDPATGQLKTNPKEIIDAINEHWSKTFQRIFDPDTPLMRRWLSEFPRRFANCPIEEWIPTREEVQQAIMSASHSAAGPDGVPFEAFKAVPELCSRLLCAGLDEALVGGCAHHVACGRIEPLVHLRHHSIHCARCAEEPNEEIRQVTSTQRLLHRPQRASW